MALLSLCPPLIGCTCGVDPAAPACSLVGTRDVAFLGRVAFSNDDGSGRFTQSTLVQFDVEEIYKGLAQGVKDVWIDPGSFTSCYQRFRVGDRYVVFAHNPSGTPSTGTVTMSTRQESPKPLPPVFDSRRPPKVYVSTSCDGSREAAHAAADISWLRAFVSGKTTTRIFGRILEEQGTPLLHAEDEVGLAGATVRIEGPGGKYEEISSSAGAYSFEGVPDGTYSLDVSLDQYRLERGYQRIKLAPRACLEVNPKLVTDGEISGTARGPNGRPIAGLKIQIARVLPGGKLRHLFASRAKTDASGHFLLTALPHGDFLLGVNLGNVPTRETPYPTVYYPGSRFRSTAQALHLKPGEHISGLKLLLPEPLAPRSVSVIVVWPNGTPANRVQVFTDVNHDDPAGVVITDASGKAEPPCLQQLPYRISARDFVDTDPTKNNRRIMDGEVILPAGREPVSLRIVLNRPGLVP